MVLIKISPALDLMVPPGMSKEEVRIALATLLSVRLYSCSVRSDTSMEISYGRV